MGKFHKAVILLLSLAALTAVIVPGRAEAATCLRSAEAVKHAFPVAWPVYSKRKVGHKGTKCWFAGARTDPQSRKVKTKVITARRASEQHELARLSHTMRALVWIAPRGDSFSDRFGSTFDDRFAAVAETTGRPSELQRALDPVGAIP